MVLCATIFLMKEQYFTPESIHTLSSRWLKAYARPKRLKSQPFDINRAALLVLDMQEYFLNPESHAYIPSAKAILPGINLAISYFRTNHRPIIATKHVNSRNDAGMMASWWSEIMTESHLLIGLHPDLDLKEEEIIQKKQYDAFYQSELTTFLNTSQIDQLVISGVMTHLCCETTARTAFVQGYEVYFLVDGTATYNQKFHKATLQNLAHGFAVLTSVEDLVEGLKI